MITAAWIPMMAAMMLPAIARRVRDRDGVLTAPVFAGSYAAVWALVGLAVHALYEPPVPLALVLVALALV